VKGRLFAAGALRLVGTDASTITTAAGCWNGGNGSRHFVPDVVGKKAWEVKLCELMS
jgi:hypothetical protein